MKVDLAGKTSVKVPARSPTPAVLAKFVGEGQPIPAGRAGLQSATVVAHKLALIAFFSEELAAWSVPSIESVLRASFAEDLGKGIDAVMFGATAETATVPAGLFNGATSVTATTGGGHGGSGRRCLEIACRDRRPLLQ